MRSGEMREHAIRNVPLLRRNSAGSFRRFGHCLFQAVTPRGVWAFAGAGLLLLSVLFADAGRVLAEPPAATARRRGAADRRREQGQGLRAGGLSDQRTGGRLGRRHFAGRLRLDQFPRRSALRQGDAMRHGRRQGVRRRPGRPRSDRRRGPRSSSSAATISPTPSWATPTRPAWATGSSPWAIPSCWPSISSPRSPTGSFPACIATRSRPTSGSCWSTPTACKPTPRSTPATRAARCSTPRGG